MLRASHNSPVRLKKWPLLGLLVAVLLAAGAIVLALAGRPAPAAALSVSGPIQDAVTAAPVPADVYVDGRLVQSQVVTLDTTVPLFSGRPTEIRVKAAGYRDWVIAVGGGAVRRLAGTVRLQPNK